MVPSYFMVCAFRFHIRNVENANQAAVISLKNTVWRQAERTRLKEIITPKKIFVPLFPGDKSAAQRGELSDMIVKIGPNNPIEVALAIKSLWGCEKFGALAGRYGIIALNFPEIP